LNLRWTNKRKGAEVWATSDKGVVGMRGTVVFVDDDKAEVSWGNSAIASGLFLALAGE
jgi:hypothetical protein